MIRLGNALVWTQLSPPERGAFLLSVSPALCNQPGGSPFDAAGLLVPSRSGSQPLRWPYWPAPPSPSVVIFAGGYSPAVEDAA